MNNLLNLFVINVSNYSENIFRNFLDPFVSSLGDWAFALIIIVLAGVFYGQTKNIVAPFVFFIVMGVIGNFIVPFQIGAFFGIIGGIGLCVVIYLAFVHKGREF